MGLTEIDKAAPSEQLAKRLEDTKAYEGEQSKLDEQQATCVGFSVSQAGFSLECILKEATDKLNSLDNRPELAGVRATLFSVKYWAEIGLSNAKDAAFILDGYHAWHKQNIAWEEEVSEDLDTCGYAGKWKSAKEGVTREKPDLNGSAYWDAVRTYFLELGGCYLSERCKPADESAPARALPIIPVLPYAGEPMKVRQG